MHNYKFKYFCSSFLNFNNHTRRGKLKSFLFHYIDQQKEKVVFLSLDFNSSLVLIFPFEFLNAMFNSITCSCLHLHVQVLHWYLLCGYSCLSFVFHRLSRQAKTTLRKGNVTIHPVSVCTVRQSRYSSMSLTETTATSPLGRITLHL